MTARTIPPASFEPAPLHPRLTIGLRKGLFHQLSLLIVFVTVASGAIVFTNPALVDVLTMALIIGLPVVGLAIFSPGLLAFGAVLLVIAGCHMFASTLASETERSLTHSAITLYLYASAVIFAAFVARRPRPHTELLLKAFVLAAMVAVAAGVVGYFALVPGGQELFTKYGRAAGPFKDPNVYGPFLIAPLLYTLHVSLTRRGVARFAGIGGLSILSFGILLSFSRGAWGAAVVALMTYLLLTFLTAKTRRHQFNIGVAVIFGGIAVSLALLAAANSDSIGRLLEERAQLTQSYDEGPEGRFGGQARAIDVIVSNPFGIGSLEFVPNYHPEEVHNVYLTMFLNSGWLGGFLFLVLMAFTVALGFRHAFRRTETQALFQVAFSALFATILLGALIDSDHWRHLYLLLGMVWGLMLTDRRIARAPRLIQPVTPQARRPFEPRLAFGRRTNPPRRAMRLISEVPNQPMLVDVTGYSQHATRRARIKRTRH